MLVRCGYCDELQVRLRRFATSGVVVIWVTFDRACWLAARVFV